MVLGIHGSGIDVQVGIDFLLSWFELETDSGLFRRDWVLGNAHDAGHSESEGFEKLRSVSILGPAETRRSIKAYQAGGRGNNALSDTCSSVSRSCRGSV